MDLTLTQKIWWVCGDGLLTVPHNSVLDLSLSVYLCFLKLSKVIIVFLVLKSISPTLSAGCMVCPYCGPSTSNHVLLMPVSMLTTSRIRNLEKIQASILVAFLIPVTKYLTKITSQKRRSLAHSWEVTVHYDINVGNRSLLHCLLPYWRIRRQSVLFAI